MNKILPILLFSLIATICSGQILVPKKDYVPEVRKARYSFGFSLIAGSHQSLVSFAIVRELPDSTKEYIYLRKDTFIRQMMGVERSKANPDTINYFEEYDIPISVLDNLWKLKHKEHPYSMRPQPGWASGNIPSPAQFDMLAPYGITRISDYCYGHNLIKLLIKVSDPIWVAEYQTR